MFCPGCVCNWSDPAQTTEHPEPMSRVSARHWALLCAAVGAALPPARPLRRLLLAHLRYRAAALHASEEGKFARRAEQVCLHILYVLVVSFIYRLASMLFFNLFASSYYRFYDYFNYYKKATIIISFIGIFNSSSRFRNYVSEKIAVWSDQRQQL